MLPQIKEKKRENGFDQGRGSRSKLKKREENNGSNENSSIQGENAKVDG